VVDFGANFEAGFGCGRGDQLDDNLVTDQRLATPVLSDERKETMLARLNENYEKLMSKLSAKRKKMLREAQRAWIKFRDANCSFYFDPESGTAAVLAGNGCFLQATADRAKELRLLMP
jgi:uncharacterized protein YecT (DUF1311 family)